MTPLAEKLPTMSDADLKALRTNAARMVGHGSPVQATTAADIIPLIDDEVVRRAGLPAAPKTRAPVKKKVVPASGHQTALPTKVA
jgi:hypothetical protein